MNDLLFKDQAKFFLLVTPLAKMRRIEKTEMWFFTKNRISYNISLKFFLQKDSFVFYFFNFNKINKLLTRESYLSDACSSKTQLIYKNITYIDI